MAMIDPHGERAHWLPDTDWDCFHGSIGDKLRQNAEQGGGRPAIKWPVGAGRVDQLSYRELLDRAERAAQWLLEQGAQGDRIALWSINHLQYAVLLHAISLAGMIAVPYNPGWTDEEVAYSSALCAPILAFVGFDGRGHALCDRASAILRCPVYNLVDLPTFAAANNIKLPIVRSSEPYLIQFTSGTTGRPKGATLSHRAALIGGGLAMATQGPPAKDTDVWLTPVPFCHISGSCCVALGALYVGGSYVLLEKFSVDLAVSLIEPAAVTRMGGVPTMWHDIVSHPHLPDDPRICVIGLGGANVSSHLARRIEKRTGGVISIVLGMSECPAVTVTGLDQSIESRVGTIGRPVPHAEVKIVNPVSGTTVGCGVIGEICVRGPMVMDGYWSNDEATAAAIDADGFYHTGDLGSMERDGVCRIHGRKRELIIRGGENIYPAEIENALMQCAGVEMAAVVAVPDERLGEKVAAIVKLAPGIERDEPHLREEVSKAVAYFKVPEIWRFVTDMPVTALGKVKKVELEANLRDEFVDRLVDQPLS